MKRMLLLILLVSVLFSLSSKNPDDIENHVGLELEHYDNVLFEVYAADINYGIADKIDKISISRDSLDTGFVYFFFKTKVTSTHTIYLTLSTDGPLKKDGNRDSEESIDYTLMYAYTYRESGDGESYDEDDKINYKIDIKNGIVFGKLNIGSSGSYDYTDKAFYHIGHNGYLNINEALMSLFYVQILKENIHGRQIGTYSSNIYLTATTAD